MNEEQMQQPNMTPDEAAASLSFATMLSEGMMPQAPQEAPVSSETAPGSEETPEQEELPMEEEMPEEKPEEDTEIRIAKMETMMAEMKGMMEKMMETKHGETE
ncbi:MAG: hypothetical protein AAB922_03385 [Patescibacteria group bacterium]